MARSTTRGLLYTAPPTDDEERVDERSDESTSTMTADSDGTNHASAVADD
ncbi:hypothetical protein MUK72_05390 [Halococcus dombrowskii]|uniref:Uncharacterized protein n=1 Tax=Halococcus dombrowskii TaxID=179637 RepID=A0AAX3ATX8_HALDO|nr:hypothetical protein [Halococcus dombrowskii]UOO96143.1 hypothetical protein MUK72_05390 [Halococcus dombrowskii]